MNRPRPFETDAALAGLALSGGRSHRFGSEKAVAVRGGRALVEWPLAALAAVCARVAVSAPAGSGAAALALGRGLAVLEDDPALASGPLAGVAAGLAWARQAGFDRLATLPCDTPGVGPAHLLTLAEALGEAACAFAVTADGPHGLCAIWRVALFDRLAARLAAGAHPRVQDVLAEIGARGVWFDDAAAFANVNRPADL